MAVHDKLEVYKRMWGPGAPAGFSVRLCTLSVSKVTISTCVRTVVKKVYLLRHVRLSARMNNSAPTGRIFNEI